MATTDHASRRPHQGAGRHRIRRRVGGQCGGRRGRLGSLIPHARAIGALVIAMIQTAFGTRAMPSAGRAHRATTGRVPAGGRTIRLAAIARGADRQRAATAPTGLESQRGVHVVGTTALDWTAFRNRGTNETTGSVCRSIETVTEGLEGSAPGPHLHSSPPDSLLQADRPPSAGRSAAGCGPHRRRHDRRRTPVSPSTTAEQHRSEDSIPRFRPTLVQNYALLRER